MMDTAPLCKCQGALAYDATIGCGERSVVNELFRSCGVRSGFGVHHDEVHLGLLGERKLISNLSPFASSSRGVAAVLIAVATGNRTVSFHNGVTRTYLTIALDIESEGVGTGLEGVFL